MNTEFLCEGRAMELLSSRHVYAMTVTAGLGFPVYPGVEKGLMVLVPSVRAAFR